MKQVKLTVSFNITEEGFKDPTFEAFRKEIAKGQKEFQDEINNGDCKLDGCSDAKIEIIVS